MKLPEFECGMCRLVAEGAGGCYRPNNKKIRKATYWDVWSDETHNLSIETEGLAFRCEVCRCSKCKLIEETPKFELIRVKAALGLKVRVK